MCRHSLKLIPKRLCSYCTKLDVYWRRKCGFLERTQTLESDGLEVESSRLILGKLHSLSEPQFSNYPMRIIKSASQGCEINKLDYRS